MLVKPLVGQPSTTELRLLTGHPRDPSSWTDKERGRNSGAT